MTNSENLFEKYTPTTVAKLITTLNSISYHTSDLTDQSLQDLLGFGDVMKDMRSYEKLNLIWINICHMRIIVSEHFVFNFLETTALQRCQVALESYQPVPNSIHEDWLTRLILKVAYHLHQREPIHIISTTYLSEDIIPKSEYKFQNRRRNYYNELVQPTHTHLSIILRQWLNLSIDFKTTAKVFLIDTLIAHFGVGITLLPAVWELYDTMPSWLFNDEKPIQRGRSAQDAVSFKPEYMKQFTDTIVALNHVPHPESSLNLLARAYQNIIEKIKSYPALSTSSAFDPLQVLDPSFNPYSALQVESVIAPLSPPAASLPSDNDKVAAKLMVRFLDDAWIVYQGSKQQQTVFATSEQNAIAANPDFLSPLRHFGPSVRYLVGDGIVSGIDAEFARTNSGLFSLLCFRGILFNTNLLREYGNSLDLRFDSADAFWEWERDVREIFPGRPPSFYCNPFAIAKQPSNNRDFDNFYIYSDTALASDWSTFVNNKALENGKLSVLAVIQWIRNVKTKQPIPDFGDLSQYLLTADLCSIGLCQIPSPEEMGLIIHQLNRGAISGLKVLRYLSDLPNSQLSAAGIQTAFLSFYQDVDQLLSDDQKINMWWNSVTAEHSLCKISRMKKKYYKVELR